MTWAAHSLDDDDVMSIASLKLKIIQLAAGFAIERGSKKQNEKLQFFPLSHFIFTQTRETLDFAHIFIYMCSQSELQIACVHVHEWSQRMPNLIYALIGLCAAW